MILSGADISRHVWETKYRYADHHASERTIADTWRRVARALAAVEPHNVQDWEERFFGILGDFRFLPGGRIQAGAGTAPNVTLFNCFVVGTIEDSIPGIFRALQEGAVTTTADALPNAIGDVHANSNTTSPVRLFAGLAVAPEIARELLKFAACIEGPSVRLVAPADVHVTLVPPWREASVPAAIEKLGLAARACEAFWPTFPHIGYGPQPGRPRMLWVDCAAGQEIAVLRASLLQAYGQTDERPFRPHVTLARIRNNAGRIARRHPIDQELSFAQRIETVELFQSPPPGEAGYRIVASARLEKTSGTVRRQCL